MLHDDDKFNTSSALLEQLVYIDNFMNTGSAGDLTPNLDIDGQLSMDLAAFADDSFIFPDEDKPKAPKEDRGNHLTNHVSHYQRNRENRQENHDLHHSQHLNQLEVISENEILEQDDTPPYMKQEEGSYLNDLNVLNLPKFPVPPGAKSSLVSAGLSQNQIDLLSALIAQHQTSLGNDIPGKESKEVQESIIQAIAATPDSVVLPSQATPYQYTPVRQHNHIPGVMNSSAYFYNENSTGLSVNMNSNQGLPNSSEDTYNDGEQHGESSELDKRRRNTAALARFRIKKKMKEKQMEHQLHSLGDLIKDFELKVQQLEMENKLLRNLIIEKGSQKSDHELRLLKERAQNR